MECALGGAQKMGGVTFSLSLSHAATQGYDSGRALFPRFLQLGVKRPLGTQTLQESSENASRPSAVLLAGCLRVLHQLLKLGVEVIRASAERRFEECRGLRHRAALPSLGGPIREPHQIQDQRRCEG